MCSKCHMCLVKKVSMTRNDTIIDHRSTRHREVNTDQLQLRDIRLHFDKMFLEIFLAVGDLSPEVCACVRVCVCEFPSKL